MGAIVFWGWVGCRGEGFDHMKSGEALPNLIPRTVLFGNPERAHPRLSVDGERLAFLAPWEGVMNIWVASWDGSGARAVTHDRGRGIRTFFWAEDGAHLLYLQDQDGNENWHVFRLNPDSGEVVNLTPDLGVQARILAVERDHPDRILVGLNLERSEVHDVYEIELATGRRQLVFKNPGNAVGFLIDRNLQVRGYIEMTAEGARRVWYRDAESEAFRLLVEFGFEDAGVSGVYGLDRAGNRLLLADSTGRNTAALRWLDLRSGKSEWIAEDPNFDVADVLLHPDTYEVQAVAFTRARREWMVLDSSLAEEWAWLERQGHGELFISSRDRADRRWVVTWMRDTGAARFMLFDRETRNLKHLFDSRSDLEGFSLAAMEPIEIQARDGLTLHGYITFPVGLPRKNLPLVLKVHGGPWARDTWGFDPEVQWLANRGAICLQINFRGSAGFGKSFLNAGNREWGRAMQDDLIDAVQWAIGQGYADPKRLAIMGASYGGYAALAGAVFTPNFFRAAISVVGPSNLITLIESIPPYWRPLVATFYRRVGHPVEDRDFLMERSPLTHVDRIQIPMLIAQGANDPRVKQSESDQMVQAMRAKGLEVEYLLFQDEGHGFVRPENRLRFYAVAERFLARHLGTRFEPEKEEIKVQAGKSDP